MQIKWLMASGSRSWSFLLFFLAGAVLLSLTGCFTPDPTAPESFDKNDILNNDNCPRIHSIGSTAILDFEKGKEITIPIEGQNLKDAGIDIAASVEAPYPLVAGIDYYLDRDGTNSTSSLIFLHIVKSATTNLNSKDHLLINVSITERRPPDATASAAYELDCLSTNFASVFSTNELDQIKNGLIMADTARQFGMKTAIGRLGVDYKANLEKWLASVDTNFPPVVLTNAFEEGYLEGQALAVNATNPIAHSLAARRLSSDSRTFILFTPNDYRTEVLANQIEIQNITAFPLPETETRKLFGDFVASKFYAVRLTLLNPTKNDQIVSLGLIKAYGRALVEPAPASQKTRYTIPIEVAPQSQQQVYTMVQSPKGAINDFDEPGELNDDQAIRDWSFGALELVGAMATAYGTGFGASEDYIKAVALATGAGIPGLDKFWTDKRPFNLLNIVNFAMPDLVKIPRGGSLDGKYLFFSKGKLQAILQDSQLYELESGQDPASAGYSPFKNSRYYARVICLEFDTMQIPFENTTETSGTTNLASQVELLKTIAKSTLADYQKIRGNWTQMGAGVAGTFNGITSTLAADDYNKLQDSLTNAIKNDAVITTKKYADIGVLTNLLLAVQTNANVLKPSSISSNLIDSGVYGQSSLTTALNQLQGIETGLLEGQPDSLFQDTVNSVAKTVNPAQALLSYYKSVADVLQNDVIDAVGKVNFPNNSFTTNVIPQIADSTNVLNSALLKIKPPNLK
jgi:hypothetical protein